MGACSSTTHDEDDNDDNDDDNDNDDVSLSSSTTSTVETSRIIRPKVLYVSPRCTTEDDQIFPTDHSLYQSNKRWKYISEQAGSHRQDGSVLTIGRKFTPKALKNGMTKQVASRVRCLNLWLDHNEDILPEWLDVVAILFVNLEHFSFSEDIFPGEEEMTVSARMRRLYVLYRLPSLKSIDELVVTPAETKLARPNTPNGERVKRDEWVGSESLLDDEEGEDEMEDEEQPDDATESINNYTAKELGVEEKVAEMDQPIVDSLDEDLAGEELLDLTTSSSGSGEQREDSSSNNGNTGDRDTAGPVRYRLNSVESQTSRSVVGDAVEVDLSGAVRSVRLGRSVGSPSQNATQRQRPTLQVDAQNQEPMSPSRQLNQILLQADTLELVSVASSHHELTAFCGVLAFRSDRACAPRVRLPFCGQNRKKVSDDDNLTMRIKAKKALRQNYEKQNAACPSVQRQSSMKSPSLMPTDRLKSKSKFFPADKNPSSTTPAVSSAPLDDQSANKKVPPSKSLSSPFPMQFRERPKCLQISTEEPNCSTSTSSSDKEQTVPETPRGSADTMETIASPLPLSPRGKSPTQAAKTAIKGDLPPPCPSGSRRRIVVTTTMTPLRSRKSRRRMRQVKSSKENARSTSVFDLEEDDEEEDDCDDEEEEGEFFDEQEVDTLANVDLLKQPVVADVAYNV
jgi:hypothetical protein